MKLIARISYKVVVSKGGVNQIAYYRKFTLKEINANFGNSR